MRNQRNRIADRLGTLLLSLVLALIIWLIATNQQNPIIQQTFTERLPVTVRGLNGSVAPIQDLSEQQVEVTVRAPERSWETLDVSDFTAYIDLTDHVPGEYDIAVQASVVDPQVDIVNIFPPELHVELDEIILKRLTVEAAITGESADNYVALEPIIEPVTVTVSGPATLVNQITSAKTSVRLDNAKSQVVDGAAPILLVDARDDPVSQVQAEPTVVKVVVPIEQQAGRKEVAVRPVLDGEPAAGYRLSSVRVTPSTVVLEGDGGLLEQVPGFIETLQLSLQDATGSIEERIELVLPEGVTAQEGSTVSIAATITPIESGTTLEQKPVVQGLGTGLEASVALETVEVILSGPQPLLESMEPDDMFVILDLAGLLPGSHAVTPRVVLPDGISEKGVLPETVEVVVTSIATQTAEPVETTDLITGTLTPENRPKLSPIKTPATPSSP